MGYTSLLNLVFQQKHINTDYCRFPYPEQISSWCPMNHGERVIMFVFLCHMLTLPTGIHLKENSWRAKAACRIMKAHAVAIVFGNTIHLWNITREEFLQNPRLVRHELMHVEQYRRLGYWRFIYQYLIESWRKGYYNNRFEVEARAAERGEK